MPHLHPAMAHEFKLVNCLTALPLHTSGSTHFKMSFSAKLTILQRIKDNKNTLLGKLSDTLTRDMQRQKWEEIAAEAKALGVIAENRRWTYLRDATWQNWRKRSIVSSAMKHFNYCIWTVQLKRCLNFVGETSKTKYWRRRRAIQ